MRPFTPAEQEGAARIRAAFPNASRAFLRANGIDVTPEAHAAIYGAPPAVAPSQPVAVAGQTKPARPKTAPSQPRPAKRQGMAASPCPTESAEQAALIVWFRANWRTLLAERARLNEEIRKLSRQLASLQFTHLRQ